MKKLFAFLSLVLCLCMLASCAGTPVIYHGGDCDCPENSGTTAPSGNPENTPPPSENALKTGLGIITKIKDSKNAAADGDGKGQYDVTMAAVLVDPDGIIRACVLDAISTSVAFNASGAITSDKTAAISTKNELGDNYTMPSGSWKAQAASIASYAVGKTASQFKNGAIDESTGKAPAGSDLASSATFYIGDCISAIEKAVTNATYLGAEAGDELRLSSLSSIKSSADVTPATGEKPAKNGVTQLDSDIVALTLRGAVISSCSLDSVQAKVEFDASGVIQTDTTSAPKTKNELGSAYNMVLYGGAKFEWNIQAAAFSSYVTGKTAAQVAGIAVDTGTKPTGEDLSASVTIAIGGYQALVQKACQ